MRTNWFKRCGWFHFPVSWQGAVLILMTLAFCAQVFWAVDRRSHSVSDTLYGIFPFFSCAVGRGFLRRINNRQKMYGQSCACSQVRASTQNCSSPGRGVGVGWYRGRQRLPTHEIISIK